MGVRLAEEAVGRAGSGHAKVETLALVRETNTGTATHSISHIKILIHCDDLFIKLF